MPIEVRQYQAMDALVDTGAMYLVVARKVLKVLGVEPVEKSRFSLADGRFVEYDIGLVSVRIDGRTLPVLCMFGDEGSEPLFGAIALESFLLAPDPVNQRLIPVLGRLMRAETRETRT